MICTVWSTVGGCTRTVWKRRSRAPSFSMCLRYSLRVVAPMHWSSPRESAGLSIEEASIDPSAAPAPTSVWISSMKITTFGVSVISFMIVLSRSSNWPRYLVPATRDPRSSCTMRLPSSVLGTCPATMRWARPSAIAVLPTPGSPMSTGLFLVRRERIWMTRSISSARPITGSSLDSFASLVRSRENSLSSGVSFFSSLVLGEEILSREIVSLRSIVSERPKLLSTWAAMPESSLIRPSSRCSVPM